jgi:hypothetical protein
MTHSIGGLTDAQRELLLLLILTFSIPLCVYSFVPLFERMATGELSLPSYLLLGTSIAWTAVLTLLLTSFYIRAAKRKVNRLLTE